MRWTTPHAAPAPPAPAAGALLPQLQTARGTHDPATSRPPQMWAPMSARHPPWADTGAVPGGRAAGGAPGGRRASGAAEVTEAGAAEAGAGAPGKGLVSRGSSGAAAAAAAGGAGAAGAGAANRAASPAPSPATSGASMPPSAAPPFSREVGPFLSPPLPFVPTRPHLFFLSWSLPPPKPFVPASKPAA